MLLPGQATVWDWADMHRRESEKEDTEEAEKEHSLVQVQPHSSVQQ